LLDISRLVGTRTRLDVKPLQLVRVHETAIDIVRPTAEAKKKITLQALLDPATSRVAGDPKRLRHVLWDLLSNVVSSQLREAGFSSLAGNQLSLFGWLYRRRAIALRRAIAIRSSTRREYSAFVNRRNIGFVFSGSRARSFFAPVSPLAIVFPSLRSEWAPKMD
jgi:hypothetical protein